MDKETYLNTQVALALLSVEEEVEFQRRVEAIKASMRGEAEKVRTVYIGDRSDEIAKKRGISKEEARRTIEAAIAEKADLYPDFPLKFDHHGEVSVADVLADLKRYDGATLADPLEPDYNGSRNIAKFYTNNGKPVIHSFAHGGKTYFLHIGKPRSCEDDDNSIIEAAIARLAEDVGAVFESRVIEALRAIRNTSPADYQRYRKRIKDAGAGVGELDRLVCANGGGESAEDASQGRRFEFESIELWDKEVTASSLLNELSATFARYLILPPHGATTLSLWTMHTYLMDEFSTDPYLGFTSPEKRCGKSRALTLLSLTCHRPVLGGNITPSALYRVIDAHAPALLIDELDTFLKDVELRGILNAGYTRSTAFVTRCVGDDHDPRQFAVWGAKAFGLIGKLHGTLEDRTVIIRMRRKKKDERIERLREKDKASFKHLRQKCLRFAHDNRLRIREAEPELPNEINDRAQDIWEPLFAIASLAGSVWTEKARKAAIALSGQIDIDADSIRVQLLADIYQAFKDKAVEWLSSTELVDALTAIEDHPWCEFNKGKPLTAKGLKNLLAAFEVKPMKERASNGYHVAQFEDPFSRYLSDLPPLSSTSSTSQAQSGFEGNSHTPQNENGGRCENGGNPHSTRPVEDVEHRRGIQGGGGTYEEGEA